MYRPPYIQQPQSSSNTGLILFIIFMLLLLIGLGVLAWWFLFRKDVKEKNGNGNGTNGNGNSTNGNGTNGNGNSTNGNGNGTNGNGGIKLQQYKSCSEQYLKPDGTLNPGQCILSEKNSSLFGVNSQGDIGLYKNIGSDVVALIDTNGSPIFYSRVWSPNVSCSDPKGCNLTLKDTQAVLTDSTGKELWSSQKATGSPSDIELKVQDDQKVCIYGKIKSDDTDLSALWCSQ